VKRLFLRFLAWLGLELVPEKTPLARALEIRSTVDSRQPVPILDYYRGTEDLTPGGEAQLRTAAALAEFTARVMEAKGLGPSEVGDIVARMWYAHEDEELWKGL